MSLARQSPAAVTSLLWRSVPFVACTAGTLGDVYRTGHEFIGHSTCPAPEPDPATFRVVVGGPDCTQPYAASVFDISALSFGALSANAIRALNLAAREGRFDPERFERQARSFGPAAVAWPGEALLA